MFRKLLEVHIWHDYLLQEGDSTPSNVPLTYHISELFDIIPSKRTRAILQSYDLLYRSTNTGFILLSRVKEAQPNETFSIFDEGIKLSFFIQVKHPGFSVMTNLPFEGFNKNLFYFSNLKSNILNIGDRAIHFLSNPLSGFKSGHTYLMGELIRAKNQVAEVINVPVKAIRNNRPIPKTWAVGKNTQYVTKTDRMPIGAQVFQYRGDNLNPEQEVIFRVKNSFQEDVIIESKKYPEDPEKKLEHTLSLNNQSEGIYTIFLDENPIHTSYLLPNREFSSPPLGVIELFHTPHAKQPEVPEGYRFIDIGEDPAIPLSNLANRVYHLHFKNRMTFWRYVSGNEETTLDEPRPLSKFHGKHVDQGKKMPDPGLSGLEKEIEPGNPVREKYISKIYL